MKYINVLLDIPISEPTPIYTYRVEDDQEAQAVLGKRVAVELGRKKVEGWIIDEIKEPPHGVKPKTIIKLFEEETVFNSSLLKLAGWISDTYVCPLSIAIKAMQPPRSKRNPEIVVPTGHLLSPNALAEMKPQVAMFMETLREMECMEWGDALRILPRGELEELISQGWIRTMGSAPIKKGAQSWQYILDCFTPEIHLPLLRKAPRQAQAMQVVMERHSINASELEKSFGKKILLALMEKGYLSKEPVFPILTEPDFSLSLEQITVIKELEQEAGSGLHREVLLFGVTGSGKTEIYLQLARKVIKAGKRVIVLVPEIALTRHLTEIFVHRIPNMAVLHSRMPAGERVRLWSAMARGEIDLVLGTRLAVFAPLPDIGLIIVDEEQENTYKQEEIPRYHAREAARKRAEIDNALLLLGSATPSLESFGRALAGPARLLQLRERAGEANLPEIVVQDLRRVGVSSRRQIISPLLLERLQEGLNQGRQSILFINRRGHSPLTICRVCGKAVQCSNCSVALSYHHQTEKNLCHYCGYNEPPRKSCPTCGSPALQQQGVGTQRVEQEIKQLFPGARVRRLDFDSSSSGLQQEILAQMGRGEIDILIGTQMVAKGLDFPEVSLVGILDADGMINLPDFRSGERGFQLMVQAAGRAGRGAVKGQVIIQTFNPDHYVIQKAAKQDYEGFFREEDEWRKTLNYPPYTHILRVISSSENEETAAHLAESLARRIEEALDAQEEAPLVLGPAPCPLLRLHKRYRYQILVKSSNILLLSSIGRYIINKERPADARVEVDVDPLVTM